MKLIFLLITLTSCTATLTFDPNQTTREKSCFYFYEAPDA